MNLIRPTAELQKLFDKLNLVEFHGALPDAMIAIQTYGRGKRALYGWCTVQKIWKTDADSKMETMKSQFARSFSRGLLRKSRLR